MTDQCKHCQLRGNLKACMAIECSKHEDWYPQQLQQQNDKLTADNAALVEALEGCVCDLMNRDGEMPSTATGWAAEAIEALRQAKGGV